MANSTSTRCSKRTPSAPRNTRIPPLILLTPCRKVVDLGGDEEIYVDFSKNLFVDETIGFLLTFVPLSFINLIFLGQRNEGRKQKRRYVCWKENQLHRGFGIFTPLILLGSCCFTYRFEKPRQYPCYG